MGGNEGVVGLSEEDASFSQGGQSKDCRDAELIQKWTCKYNYYIHVSFNKLNMLRNRISGYQQREKVTVLV